MENASGGNNNNMNGWNGGVTSKANGFSGTDEERNTSGHLLSNGVSLGGEKSVGQASGTTDSKKNGTLVRASNGIASTSNLLTGNTTFNSSVGSPPSGDDDSDDDYCVYTYKGDTREQQRMADLPSSFYQFDSSDNQSGDFGSFSGDHGNAFPRNGTGGSLRDGFMNRTANNGGAPAQNNVFSPDMDFLEMDFDPNMYADGDDGNEDEKNEVPGLLSDSPVFSLKDRSFSPGLQVDSVSPDVPMPCSSNNILPISSVVENIAGLDLQSISSPVPSASNGSCRVMDAKILGNVCASDRLRINANNINRANSTATAPVHPTTNGAVASEQDSSGTLRLVKSNTLPELKSKPVVSLSSVGSSIRPCEKSSMLFSSAPVFKESDLSWSYKARINTADGPVSEELEVGRVMIWDLTEAKEIAYSQIGKSACGATAVLNVLMALRIDASPEYVNECVGTRLRAENDDLPGYLFSRSSAGATHKDLIKGIQRASENKVCGRFFQFPPTASVSSFNKWLLNWVCKGAIPVVTRNLQVGNYASPLEIPDAWHHQMVFGVSPEDLYLNNPIEIASLSELLPQLTAESILLIRRQDLISRRRSTTDLRQLVRHKDPRWNDMNVLGQVANVFLEEIPYLTENSCRGVKTSHIKIPADYRAGVTLFIRRESPSCSLLMSSEEFLSR